VRPRLSQRKTAEDRGEVAGKERQRNVVGGSRVGIERLGRLLEPQHVMGDQLAGAAGRILDRLVVAGKGDPGIELDDPLERLDVVAERIGA
jgi:hypothetical protein